MTTKEPGSPAPAYAAEGEVPGKLSRNSVTIIAMLLSATFVVILNETIMNVALQRLMAELRVDAATVQWLSAGFLLTMAVIIPATGFILKNMTTRAVFMMAMGLFTGGTALAALAPDFVVLLLARIIQASGTAIMLPLLITTILSLVPVTKRGVVMGNVSIVISVAPAMGPTVSGLILENLSWRFMFVFVLPLSVAALILGGKYLVNVGTVEKTRLDVFSALLTVPAFGGLVYGLSQIGGGHGEQGGPAGASLAALLTGLTGLFLFVVRQLHLQRTQRALLDLRAFQFRMFTVSMLLMLLTMVALFGSVILLPIYLQEIRGLGAMTTGLVLLPGGVALGILGPVIGRIFDRTGPLPLTVAGSIIITAALWQFSRLGADAPVVWIITIHVGLSLGLALVLTPSFTTGLNPLPQQLHSHGSAIMSTVQQVAGAAGTALLVSIFAMISATSGPLTGLNAAFLTAAFLTAPGILLAAMMRRTTGNGHVTAAGH